MCLAVAEIQGNVKLTKDRTETVSFEGDELTIVVDNTLGALDYLTLCFEGSQEESRHPCPLGGVIVGILVWRCITRTSKPKQTPECNHQNDSSSSQQFRNRKKSTLRKPSSKQPIKHASNTTTTIVQTTVSPKQVAHPSSKSNNKSTTMEKPRNLTTSKPRSSTGNG
uniref:CooT family nickel-binding protein n=1 Tax=Panagrellus redivivus TaxID=6233 RepID=A0A7E4VBS1_PANRE